MSCDKCRDLKARLALASTAIENYRKADDGLAQAKERLSRLEKRVADTESQEFNAGVERVADFLEGHGEKGWAAEVRHLKREA